MHRFFVVVMALSAACGSVDSKTSDAAVKPADAAADSLGTDAATCAATPSNLVGRWRADSNANDDSGNAYNGVTVGTNFSYTTGKHGMAFLLDGSTNEVSVNDGDATWPAASFSLEGWVKTTSSAGGQLIAKYQCKGSCPTASYAYFGLRIVSGGNPIFEFRTDATDVIASITDTGHNIADGNWHHLVGVRDVPAGKANLYLDGALAGTLTLPANQLGAMTNTDGETDNVTLGASTVGGTQNIVNQLAGALDEVAIYKSALSQAQVSAIYAAPEGECH